MADTDLNDASDTARSHTPRRLRVPWLSLLVSVVVLAGLVFVAMLGRGFALPDWATERVEAGLTRSLGQGEVQVEEVLIEIDRQGVADVVLADLSLRDASGASLGQINRISARIDPMTLVRGARTPSKLEVSGAQITVRRAADGSFQLSLGGTGEAVAPDLGALLELLETAFSTAPLSDVTAIEARDLTLTLEDARSGRVWQATNGSLTLANADARLDVDVFTEVFNGTEDLASVQLSLAVEKGGGDVVLAAALGDAAARDIALQSPALSYLGVLDAPVSGAIRAVFTEEVGLSGLAATLDLGAGQLAPAPDVRPVAFDRGRVYLDYDPATARIEFSEYFVESNALRWSGSGHAFLGDFRGAWPTSLTAQLQLSEIGGAPVGVFEDPVTFERGFADVRLRLDPFSIKIGQVSLVDGDSRIVVNGGIAAKPAGWETRVDIRADRLDAARVLSLWPVAAVPNTRRWLSQNLLSGQLTDVAGALRFLPDAEPQIGLTFEFDAARVRFLPHFPPIVEGRGHAALDRTSYSMTLTEGSVIPEVGGPVRFDGSTMRVSGLDVPGQTAEISLRSDSSLEAALSLMNNRPFRILEKADLSASIADARAEVEAKIQFKLEPRVQADDVDFAATGRLSDLASDQIVTGRILTGDRLDVEISQNGIRIDGPVALDGRPIDVSVSQAFEPNAPVDLAGRFDIEPAFLDVLGVALPDGILSGRASAALSMVVPRDGPPRFSVTSRLEGLGMTVSPLGWSKAQGSAGNLELTGTLGPTPVVDRLAVSAPGLLVEGRIELAEGGGFLAANLSRLRAGGWFDAPVRIVARGEGQTPQVTVSGGQIDVRGAPSGGAGAGAAIAVPLRVALDSLRVTETLALTGLRADVTTGAGFSGSFVGRVNGGTEVRGRLTPANGRTAIRIDGPDAGRLLRDAGLFRFARGGTFEAVLTPRPGGPGFDGAARIKDTRLTEQPVIIDLLNAVSVVGILEQMQGSGVLFDTVESRFRVLPGRVVVDYGSAVGSSLGVSLDGTVNTQAGTIDMQGVLSPIYLLNSVGSFLTRRGEGLFGITFTLTGNTRAPTVTTNPLSILTPGMFRELFRRPPPSN